MGYLVIVFIPIFMATNIQYKLRFRFNRYILLRYQMILHDYIALYLELI